MRALYLNPLRQFIGVIICFIFLSFGLIAQIPTPKEVFGFEPGDDYQLANNDQMLDYFQQLAKASDRVMLREIGTSVLGKPMILLTISSKKNLRQLDKWRDISEKLARAKIDESTARDLAASGKAIVWIDGGLHATEVAGAQMTPKLAYRVATEESSEMKKIRDNTILLLMPIMNPDGLDIIANWYKRNRNTPFETTRPPWLYHHFIGHDNNRDWFMNNMPESKAVTQILYNEWYPQIVYNHHQTSPSWTRIFIPPFADPVNPNIHPGVTTGVNIVGSAMANRFALKKMPGAVSGVIYSMWWNGGMRTVPYFHNMIGILTETGHATPTPRFYHPDSIPKSIAGRRGAGHPTDGTNIFYPYPWKGGFSRFNQPVAYMETASMAVLKLGADLKEQWLYNIYAMGKDAIAKNEAEGPFAYIIPPDQWNKGEEISLINILQLGGIEIHQSTNSFTAGGKSYPAGTFIMYGAQAFRPYLRDLMEKQVYPKRTRNGQPETPYDLAGWTLPMQMGVTVDRIKDSFTAPAQLITSAVIPNSGTIENEDADFFRLSHRPNASIKIVNQLLAEGETVFWANDPKEKELETGAFIIQSKGAQTVANLEKAIEAEEIEIQGINQSPAGEKLTLAAPKIGLYKSWSASMDEGWTRWLLGEYAFDTDTLHDQDIRSSDLSGYHAIILPSQSASRILKGHAPGMMPEEYTGGLGLEGTLALKKYVEQGGRLIALDAASDFLIDQFGLPVKNATRGVSSRSFFIPGSLVKIEMEADHPLTHGMPEEMAAVFSRSRAFETQTLSAKGEGGVAELPAPPQPDVEVIARYASKDILMSGWATGERKYLAGKAAMVRIPMGSGDVVLFGFRPQFRGQPRGTYKLFFNSLLEAAAQ